MYDVTMDAVVARLRRRLRAEGLRLCISRGRYTTDLRDLHIVDAYNCLVCAFDWADLEEVAREWGALQPHEKLAPLAA